MKNKHHVVVETQRLKYEFDIRKPKFSNNNQKTLNKDGNSKYNINKNLIHMHSIPSIIPLRNLNILAPGNQDSGVKETNVPEAETTFDWLDHNKYEIEPISSPEPLCGA